MIRSLPLLAAAMLLTGCADVHAAPARHPSATPAPPRASGAPARASGAPVRADDVPPPAATPRLVVTGPGAGPGPALRSPRAGRPVTVRRSAAAPPAGPAALRPGADAMCARAARLRGMPQGWEAVCRAALGG